MLGALENAGCREREGEKEAVGLDRIHTDTGSTSAGLARPPKTAPLCLDRRDKAGLGQPTPRKIAMVDPDGFLRLLGWSRAPYIDWRSNEGDESVARLRGQVRLAFEGLAYCQLDCRLRRPWKRCENSFRSQPPSPDEHTPAPSFFLLRNKPHITIQVHPERTHDLRQHRHPKQLCRRCS